MTSNEFEGVSCITLALSARAQAFGYQIGTGRGLASTSSPQSRYWTLLPLLLNVTLSLFFVVRLVLRRKEAEAFRALKPCSTRTEQVHMVPTPRQTHLLFVFQRQ